MAIALSNEGKREVQRKAGPIAQPSDERLMALTATLLNRAATDLALPESGYRVAYQELPLSPQERGDRRAHVIELIAAGLMSQLEGYMFLNPGITPETAAERLKALEPPEPTPAPAPPAAA